jgi:hypothetical protein
MWYRGLDHGSIIVHDGHDVQPMNLEFWKVEILTTEYGTWVDH